MIKSTEDLIHFGNGMFLDFINDLIKYQFPDSDKIYYYIIPTLLNTGERIKKLCFKKIENNKTTYFEIFISLKYNSIFFILNSNELHIKPKKHIVDLEEIENIDDLFKIISENIIIAEKD